MNKDNQPGPGRLEPMELSSGRHIKLAEPTPEIEEPATGRATLLSVSLDKLHNKPMWKVEQTASAGGYGRQPHEEMRVSAWSLERTPLAAFQWMTSPRHHSRYRRKLREDQTAGFVWGSFVVLDRSYPIVSGGLSRTDTGFFLFINAAVKPGQHRQACECPANRYLPHGVRHAAAHG